MKKSNKNQYRLNKRFTAQYFAEWQRKKDQEIDKLTESPDLDEASWNYSNRDGITYGQRYAMQIDFKAGAKWQHGKDFDDLLQSEMKFPKEFYEKGRFDMRDEMMKDAVGGEYWDGSIYLNNRPTEYKDGDKVKIIIIKEEQE
jgi:hypothetical protein